MIYGAVSVAAAVFALVTFVRQVRWERANNAVREVEARLIAKLGTEEELTEVEQFLLWELNLVHEEL